MRQDESAVPAFGSQAQREADDALGIDRGRRNAAVLMDLSKLAPFGKRPLDERFVPLSQRVFPISIGGGSSVSVGDMIAWDALDPEVRSLARRVMHGDLDQAYDDGWDDAMDEIGDRARSHGRRRPRAVGS